MNKMVNGDALSVELVIGARTIRWAFDSADGYWNRYVDGTADGRHSRGIQTAYEDFSREIEEFNFNARRRAQA